MTRTTTTLFLLTALAGCPEATTTDAPTEVPTSIDGRPVIGEGLIAENFVDGALAEEVTIEDCTLADGTETTCYRVVIAGMPTNHGVEPVCPRTIDDVDVVGLWSQDGEILEVDGPFIENMATYYDDPNWQMYDEETGEVTRTQGATECQDAGGMPIDPAYANYCMECLIEDIGGPIELEYLIPTEPRHADQVTEIDRTAPGISLNGVRIELQVAVDEILAAYQIAPVDMCGGHVNFNIGYHYHEPVGCIDGLEQCDDHAPLVGYAIDGFAIHEMLDDGTEPSDLDPCRGHEDALRGYHYHASGVGENAFIGCLSGVLVADDGPPGGSPDGPPP